MKTKAKRTIGEYLVVMAAGAGVIWHILACTESPMAFSPGGEELAFTVREPFYKNYEELLVQSGNYQLMVLGKDKELRVLEESSTHMLTGPGWSRDGKYLAYLRIPVFKDGEEKNTAVEKWEAGLPHKNERITPSTSPSSSKPDAKAYVWDQYEDRGLPSIGLAHGSAHEFRESFSSNPLVATLVVREAASGNIAGSMPIEIPTMPGENKDGDVLYALAYTLCRPQFSREEDQWIYFTVGRIAMAANPWQGKVRIFGGSFLVSAFSPDGKILAGFGEDEHVRFIRTDGSAAFYFREKGLCCYSIVWLDTRRVAYVVKNEDVSFSARFMSVDGSVSTGQVLPLAGETENEEEKIQLVSGSDGKRVVLSCPSGNVIFMDGDAGEIGRWQPQDRENEVMVSFVFSPDGRKLACKYMRKNGRTDSGRTDAVVFFSPEGKELYRVQIPVAAKPEKEKSDAKKSEASPTAAPTPTVAPTPATASETGKADSAAAAESNSPEAKAEAPESWKRIKRRKD